VDHAPPDMEDNASDGEELEGAEESKAASDVHVVSG
jgi:hypothetical protein